MWIVQTWIAVVVMCTSPGTPDEACHGVAVGEFVSIESCTESLGKIGEVIGYVHTAGKRIAVTAKCVALVPDREA